jgi:hypothetical protein
MAFRVMLPPGWAKLATMPLSTGSAEVIMTIGIVDVAFLAASTPGVPLNVTITSTSMPPVRRPVPQGVPRRPRSASLR